MEKKKNQLCYKPKFVQETAMFKQKEVGLPDSDSETVETVLKKQEAQEEQQNVTPKRNNSVLSEEEEVQKDKEKDKMRFASQPITKTRSKEQIESSWRKTIVSTKQHATPIAISSVVISPKAQRSYTTPLPNMVGKSTTSTTPKPKQPTFEITYGIESIQGHRPTQEDAHIIKQPGQKTETGKNEEVRKPTSIFEDNVESAESKKLKEESFEMMKKMESELMDDNLSFFGVFDGHGGDEASIFVSNRLYGVIHQNRKKQQDWKKIMEDSFAMVEQEFLKRAKETMLGAGD